MSQTEILIRDLLADHFNPTLLEIQNESAKHRGHTGNTTGGGHFRIKIRAPGLANHSLIERHRQIYDVLGYLIPNTIHALAIDAA